MKNKKVIISLIALFSASFVFMATMAYSHDGAIFSNQFAVGEWKTVFTEEFDAPSDWVTCETADKTITVKNESNIDAAVRIKIDEQWIANDGTTVLPLISASGNQMAIINFTENSGWQRDVDGYYYYDVDLHQNDETTSLTTGVTLNCDANLNVDTEYASATYKLKFTAQTIQYDQKSAWRTTLYEVVANQSRGSDRNIDFRVSADFGNYPFNEYGEKWTYINPGSGVFTTYETLSNTFPIHYFRGDIKNNHVIFADKCWHIIRTTTTGGVKLIYDSEVMMDGDNKTCSEYQTGITYNGKNTFSYSSTTTFPEVGYTYGSKKYKDTMSVPSTDIVSFGNDVKYEDGHYTLIDVVTGTLDEISSAVKENHHYYCDGGGLVCDEVYYGVPSNYTNVSFKFSGYDNAQEYYQSLMIGDTPSVAKTTVDGWYEENMLAYTEKLEDAVFCNDRTLHDSYLDSKDNNYSKSDIVGGDMNTYLRNVTGWNGNRTRPTLDCARKEDSYTVNESPIGNGKLKYPAALITADEVTYSGIAYGYHHSSLSKSRSSYLSEGEGYYSKVFWTMSPASDYSGYSIRFSGNYISEEYGADGQSIAPVVSLKPGTYYKSGDGTASNPIIVE